MVRTYTDNLTGEIISEEEVVARYFAKLENGRSKFSWRRIYLSNWSEMPSIIQSPSYSVVHEVVLHSNSSTNQYIGSFDDIARKTNVSRPTVSRVMDRLQCADYTRRVKDGLWMINPTKICAGTEGKKKVLEDDYFELNRKLAKTEPVARPRESSELQDRIREAYERSDTDGNE